MSMTCKVPQESEQFAVDSHWLRRGWGRREALVRVVWSTVLISGFRRGASLFKNELE